MAISDNMLARGKAVGLNPEEDETSSAFGKRVREAEAAAEPAAPSGSYGRRGAWLPR